MTEFVEAIPFLLGFNPADSLVVVSLHGSADRIGKTVRFDLPTAESSAEFPTEVAAHASLHGSSRVVLVVFAAASQTAGGLPERPLVNRIRAALERAGAAVLDCLYVRGRRFWSYFCLDPECCPADGRPLPEPGDPSTRLAVAMADAGLVALPDRAALTRMLTPIKGSERADMEQALAAAEAGFVEAVAAAGGIAAWRTAMRSAVRHAMERAVAHDSEDASPALGVQESAEILVALVDTAIRDTCWLDAERGAPADGLALWRELARRAVPPYDAPPLFLLAWSAWRRGDAVLARMAGERALASDADYGAARLLLAAMDVGLEPGELPALTARPRRARRTTAGRSR